MARKLIPIFLIATFLVALMSAILWFRSNPYEAQCLVSIQLENIPPGLTAIGEWTKILKVRIRGPKSQVASVAENNHLIYMLDLSEAKQRVNTINIQKDDFSFPKGVTVEEIAPSFVTIKMEEEIKKSFPVELTVSGKPAPGYVIADAVVAPSEIILQGPKSVLESMEQVKTKPVDVTAAQETLKIETTLDLPENVKLVFPEKRMASSVFIEESVITTTIRNVPVEGRNTPLAYSITPSMVNLDLKGHKKDLEKLSTENTDALSVFVDLKGLDPGVYVRHATILLPGNVTLMNVEPMLFTVKLKKKKESM